MNVNILSTTENKLLDRREIEAEVTFEGATPKRAELKQAIGGKVGLNPELMVLSQVTSTFGKRLVRVRVHAYPDKEKLMSVEAYHLKVREGLAQKKEKKKVVAAPKARKKE